MEHHHTLRYALDGLSITTALASLSGWLPPVASLLSIVWLAIQIGEWVYKKVKVD